MKNTFIILFLSLTLPLCEQAAAISLSECGRVIAHENGMYNFTPKKFCKGSETCPEQLDAIFKYNSTQPHNKQIHFTKLSIRTLKDNTWVVAHDQYQTVTVPSVAMNSVRETPGTMKFANTHSVKINLSEIDSATLAHYQQYNIGVYRLGDYIAHDPKADMCFMLYFKDNPNENIIAEIDALGIQERTLLESSDNNDAAWLNDHPGKQGIWFTGRVSTPANLADFLTKAKTYKYLWAIEVNVNDDTKALVTKINNETSYLTEVDAMPYGTLKEYFSSACKVPLDKIGSKLTMTSRPVDCLA